MPAFRAFVSFFALWILLSPAALAERVAWDPEKTRGVIVGVLSWQDTSIGTFSSNDRKDRELYDTLLERGVPKENLTLLLDKEATHQAILEALSQQLDASEDDETFLFYYAGHGVLRKNQVLFVPYDFGAEEGLAMREIGALMKAKLHAQRLLLFADCCYSGGLAGVADEMQAQGVPSASLTSATALLPSVSNWTFTQILVDCFSGKSAGDRDSDLTLTFDEFAAEAADAMRFHEAQQNGVTPRPWFQDLVMSSATPVDRALKEPFSRFDYVAIEQGEALDIGRLTDYSGGRFTVELQGYSERTPVKVKQEEMHALPQPPTALDSATALAQASLDGKYKKLLRTLAVEPDYVQYGEFNDYGFHEACGYRGYEDIPAGHWVYAYPNWYIWGESADGPKR